MNLPANIRSFLKKQREGYLYFTLFELLAVLAIIALVIAIAIPNIQSAKCRTLFRSLMASLDKLKTDINSAMGITQVSMQDVQTVRNSMKDVAQRIKAVKQSKCVDKNDKTSLNTKLEEILKALRESKTRAESPEVSDAIQQLIDIITGAKDSDNE